MLLNDYKGQNRWHAVQIDRNTYDNFNLHLDIMLSRINEQNRVIYTHFIASMLLYTNKTNSCLNHKHYIWEKQQTISDFLI